MRALAKSLIFALVLTIPAIAEAQISKLLGRGNVPARQHAFDRMVAQQQQAPSGALVQTQFEESIPPAVLEAAPNLQGYAGDVPTSSVTATPQDAPAPVRIQTDYSGSDTVPAYESNYAAPPAPEITDQFDNPGAYEYPIGDAIPTEVAEVFSTNNWFRGGRWYSRQEFMMLLRGDLPRVHLAVDRSQNTGNALLDIFQIGSFSTQDVDFTYESGARLTLGRILGRDVANRDHGIEFTFFGLFDYNESATVDAVNIGGTGRGLTTLLASNEARTSTQLGPLAVGFPVINEFAGFTDNATQTATYDANFNSMEINYTISGRPTADRLVMQPDGRWVRHATPSRLRALFAGLRYIRQNEQFRYTGTGQALTITDQSTGQTVGTISDQANSSYSVGTDNDLVGVQLGTEMIHKRAEWVVGFNGKVGGLLNFANRESQLQQRFFTSNTNLNSLTSQSRSESLDDQTLTFLAEIGLSVAYYVRPNTSLRMGYNLVYLNGMATATNNIGLINGFHDFEMTGDSLYHGVSVGFEMTW